MSRYEIGLYRQLSRGASPLRALSRSRAIQATHRSARSTLGEVPALVKTKAGEIVFELQRTTLS